MAELPKVVRIGDTLTNLIDKNTNQTITYTKVNNWWDGTPMTADKADGEIYRRKGVEYFLKNLGKYGELFLEKDTMAEMRDLNSTEILLLQMGYYKGVRLSGYYEKGDTPTPIEYILSDTNDDDDDGGSVIEVSNIKLEHIFKGNVDIRYFGFFETGDITNLLRNLDTMPGVTGASFPEGDTVFSISGEVVLRNISLFGNKSTVLRVTTSGITPLRFEEYRGNFVTNFIFDCNNSDTLFNSTFALLTGNTENNLFENIKFINISAYTENEESPLIPSSCPLYLVAKDTADDYSIGSVGYVRHNKFSKITFEQKAGHKQAFVIRAVTNWTKSKPTEDVGNKCEFNVFEGLHITGDYLWNMLELAGTGTINNIVRDSYFNGRAITAIDLDKGASHNIVENNHVELSLSSYSEFAQSAYVFAAINNHGSGLGLINKGNIIRGNTLRNMGLLHVNESPLEAAIGLQYVDGGEVSSNDIDGTYNAVCGFHMLSDVRNFEIRNNTGKNIISRAVTTNANQGGNDNVKIIGNSFESNDTSIRLAGTGATSSNIFISGNSLKVLDSDKQGVIVASSWINARVVDNYIYAEADKVVNSTDTTLISGNVFDGSSPYVIRTTGNAYIVDNRCLTFTNGVVGPASETARQWNNSWNSAPVTSQPYYRNDGVTLGQDASVIPEGFWGSIRSIKMATISSGVGYPSAQGLVVSFQNGGGSSAGNYGRSFDLFKSYDETSLWVRRYSTTGVPLPFVRVDNVVASSSPDTATEAAGETPTKAEFDALLAELRDVKTRLKSAGLMNE